MKKELLKLVEKIYNISCKKSLSILDAIDEITNDLDEKFVIDYGVKYYDENGYYEALDLLRDDLMWLF